MFERLFHDSNKSAGPVGEASLEKYLKLLDVTVQPFAQAFYERFTALMPANFAFDWDRNAPDNPDLKAKPKSASRLSLEFHLADQGHHYKYGTCRVALRDKYYFAKTVTWKTPKDFLHQVAVYQMIKEHFFDCTITKNKSKTSQGFNIKSSYQVITLEVFGDNPNNGYLACDITLSRFNQPLALQRLFRFLNFYGELYNHLDNQELKFKTLPASDVEFPEMDGDPGFG